MSTTTEYQSLLLDFTPRPIRAAGEYRRAMRQIERLMKMESPASGPRANCSNFWRHWWRSTNLASFPRRSFPRPSCWPT